MAIVFNSGTSRQIRSVVDAVLQAAGVTSFSLANSASFKMIAETRDGKYLTVKFVPLDQGFTPTMTKIQASSMTTPSLGAPDLDGSYGSATLSGSTITVSPTAPADEGDAVPSTALFFARPTTATNPQHLNFVRLSSTQFRIHGSGNKYTNTPIECDTVSTALVAGTKDVTTNDAPATTDLLYVEELTAGGGAADHFSAVRKDASDITIFAHNAAGALVATNTSTVRAHKFAASTKSRSQVTGTLVAGVATLTLTNAVGEILLVQQESAGGTAASHFVAFRSGATEVKVHAVTAAGALQTANTSTVTVYNLGVPKSCTTTLVAGTIDAPLAVNASDRLAVVQHTLGGDAASHFSVVRKNATEVTIFAQTAAGALINTNTSKVRVYNMGQASEDTSVLQYAIVRP